MRLMARAHGTKLSRSERQALDIFVLAFATVSRVGEIASLEVRHVAPDGEHLALRPKTGARTWQRLVKRVANTPSLRAADILWRRREEARRGGFRFVFRSGRDWPPSTASITGHLRDVTRRLGIPARVTAHSARKGTAVEALLAGVPLPVIQALGGWRDINTLQAYIGEAVRRTTSLLYDLEGTGRGTGHTAQWGRTARRGAEETPEDVREEANNAVGTYTLEGMTGRSDHKRTGKPAKLETLSGHGVLSPPLTGGLQRERSH